MDDFDRIVSQIIKRSGRFGQIGHVTCLDEQETVTNLPRAAVALVVRNSAEVAEVLIIQRAENPGDHWSGHLALPGGRVDPHDSDLIDTAVREVFEEVGLELDRDQSIIGRLEDISPRTPRVPLISITPFIALAPQTEQITLSREVAYAFWIPVHLLKSEGLVSSVSMTIDGSDHSWPAFKSVRGPIWGITERIISSFLSTLD